MSKKEKGSVPSKLTQAAMMTSIRSSSLGKTGGKNELTMNDTSGKEGLFMKAQKDQINDVGNDSEVIVGNDEMVNVGNDRVHSIGSNADDAIGANETRTIGNNQEETVGNDQSVTVGNNRSKTVATNDSHSVGMAKITTTGVANADMVGVMRSVITGALRVDVSGLAQAELVGLARLGLAGLIDLKISGMHEIHKVGQDFGVSAGNNINNKAATDIISEAGNNAGLKAGTMIVVEAPDITLKSPGGFIRLDGSGVTIKGNEVNINCSGGAAGSLGGDEPAAAAGAGAGGGSGSGTGSASGAASAAGDGLKTDFAKLLEELGVSSDVTKVIDQLFTDPMNMSFEDMLAIAPSMDQLLGYIPEDVLPSEYRNMLANTLRLGRTEAGFGDDNARSQRADKAMGDILSDLKEMGKNSAEEAAASIGLDLDLLNSIGGGQSKLQNDDDEIGYPNGQSAGAKAGVASGFGGGGGGGGSIGGGGSSLAPGQESGGLSEKDDSETLARSGKAANEEGEEMKACPTTKPDMESLPPGWQAYQGKTVMGVDTGSEAFHCGYEGIKEVKTPSPGNRQNECFYDDGGQLVDESHPYAGCGGSPNEYDASDAWDHSWNDSGGIRKSGPRGAATSAKKKADDAGKWVGEKYDATKEWASEQWQGIKDLF